MTLRAARSGPRSAASPGSAAAYLSWLGGAAAVAFVLPALFAGAFHWRRDLFALAEVALGAGFLIVYALWSGFDPRREIERRPSWGVAGALVAAAFTVSRVLHQPATPGPTGARAALEILWLGVLYGGIDGLLLSVLPVHAAWQAAARLGWTREPPGAIGSGAFSLGASLLVTLAHQLGFAGARAAAPVGSLIDSGVMTLAYLLTGNPLAPIGARIAMNVAAVLHASGNPTVLPPGP